MCDYDLPEFMDQRTVNTRKPWKCYECRRPHPAKSACVVIKGVWDGEFEQYRLCPRCVRVHEALRKEDSEGCGVAFGEVRERLRDRAYSRHSWAKDWRALA